MMFTNRFRVLFTLAVATAGVSAQLQNFDQCGQTCLNSTLTAGPCTSLTDTSCFCTSTQFQTNLITCLKNCSSQDLTAALAFQNATCSNVTSSTASSTSTSGSATNVATSSSSASSTSSSGATTVEQLPLLSAVVVIAGALMGGAFTL